MNQITIDTADLRALAAAFERESQELASIRLDLVRAWGDVAPGAYPGIERVLPWADDVVARLGYLAGTVSTGAMAAHAQAQRAEDTELLGGLVSMLLGGCGLLYAVAATQPLATWAPAVPGAAAPVGMLPLGGLGGVAGMPLLATGVGALDPLAALGAQNGALAPIAGILGTVQQVVNDPLGFLDGPQGQALAAQNGALAPIQGVLNQAQAVIDNPLGFGGVAPTGGGTDLASLEAAALQQNVNRILAGGTSPISGLSSSIANSFNGLFPGGLNDWVGGLVESAKANGRFHPGINATAALEGQLMAREQFSAAAQNFNPFRNITEGNLMRIDQINFMSELHSQSVLNSGENLRALVNSQLGSSF
jgi:hypothetical protein